MAKTAGKFKQGKYVVKNKEKYIGDLNNVVYRSSWERNLHEFFDSNINVIRWGSEVIRIPYVKPTDNRVHIYFPDYYVEYIDTKGQLIKELIELKPLNQTRLPNGNHKHKLYEQVQFAINVSKWQAAEQWCKQQGINWRIVTERSVFR